MNELDDKLPDSARAKSYNVGGEPVVPGTDIGGTVDVIFAENMHNAANTNSVSSSPERKSLPGSPQRMAIINRRKQQGRANIGRKPVVYSTKNSRFYFYFKTPFYKNITNRVLSVKPASM